MTKAFNDLNEKFLNISKKGYIKGIYNSSQSIGRTFENELSLSMNKLCMPDYNGIEIKTRRGYTKSMITLFNVVPDGENSLEVKRLKDTYGYPYRRDRRYKALYVEVYANRMTYGGRYYQYKLDVDKANKRVYLCVYNNCGVLIERRVYWSFRLLKERLTYKLNNMALVYAWTKKIDDWNYFKYYKIEFYVLKSFNKFINLLSSGKIRLSLRIDIYLDEKNYGKMYDHGCGFSLAKNDIPNLFYLYDIDTKKLN